MENMNININKNQIFVCIDCNKQFNQNYETFQTYSELVAAYRASGWQPLHLDSSVDCWVCDQCQHKYKSE